MTYLWELCVYVLESMIVLEFLLLVKYFKMWNKINEYSILDCFGNISIEIPAD